MKMMQGAALRACSKRSRTRAAPTNQHPATNSEPEMEKNANFGFTRDGAGEQSLARTGRAYEQDTFGT